MSDIAKLFDDTYAEDIDGAIHWCYLRYMKDFSETFAHVRELYQNMEDSTKLTDSDIEWVITQLPLELFSVSENLNNLKLGCEIIKLKNKDLKLNFTKDIFKQFEDNTGSVLSKEEVNAAVAQQMIEYEIILKVHTSTVLMVENQISFCREFIRGCKKIWDGRRQTEAINPIGEVVPDDQLSMNIPEYKIDR